MFIVCLVCVESVMSKIFFAIKELVVHHTCRQIITTWYGKWCPRSMQKVVMVAQGREPNSA